MLRHHLESSRYNNDRSCCIVFCDNIRSRLNTSNFGDQGTLRYPPRYSPFLNACEMAGSCLKAASKRRLTEVTVQQEIYECDAPRDETAQSSHSHCVS